MVPSRRKRVSRSPSQSNVPETSEEEREGGGERGVQLLPGVEPSLRRVFAEEPATVVGVEDVELTRGGAQPPAVAEDEDRRQGEDPRERREEVDVLHERPPADLRRERGKVEHEPGAEEHEERRCVHPVQRSLRAREAPDVAGLGSRGVRPADPRVPCRSPAPPSTRRPAPG